VILGVVRILGLTVIPCLRAEHLNGSERRLLRPALNRLGEKGSWNLEELKLEIEELIVDGAPIEIAGSRRWSWTRSYSITSLLRRSVGNSSRRREWWRSHDPATFSV
jgi:hypothetical protein